MLNPPGIAPREIFCPFGYTPAVNLLQDRFRPAPEGADEELVKALLLGCGDPRNLLFSLWCEKPSDKNIKIEFTCCDIEPARLARNIILFSLVIDSAPSKAIWNVFYHFYIPNSDLELIQEQSKELLRVSETQETWLSSSYGKVIGFLNHDTLSRLREIWARYIESAALNGLEMTTYETEVRKAVRARFKKSWNETTINPHVLRPAGVHWFSAKEVLIHSFCRFWGTGVVAGNAQDVQDLGGGQGRVNPMLTISSAHNGDFAVHLGADPLFGFHLASAFDSKSCSQQELIEKVAKLAKYQFREWCKALQDYVRSNTLRIKVFCGDALPFCHELQALHNPSPQNAKITRVYGAPWSPTGLSFHGLDQPEDKRPFDVIDTSDISEHIGMLNILPAIAPLLSRQVTSVMFTDLMLQASEDIAGTLPALLCSDVPTMSLILGLAPTAHLLRYTVNAVGNDIARITSIPTPVAGPPHCYMRIAWKVPEFGDHIGAQLPEKPHLPIIFHPKQLAGYFFKIYLTMFARDKIASMAQTFERQITSPLSGDIPVYNRMNFAVLLTLAKARVQTDWEVFIRCLVSMIEADRQLYLGPNSLLELHLSLHLLGLFTGGPLSYSPRCIAKSSSHEVKPQSTDTILGQSDVPSVVFIALVIPRKHLELFAKEAPDTASDIKTHLSVENTELGFDYNFFAIQCFFGSLSPRDDDGVCDVIPDNLGWLGKSDMIATCAVPTWPLLLWPGKNIRVRLTMPINATTMHYASSFGSDLTVFGCRLGDPNLFVLKEPPGVRFRPDNTNQSPEPSTPFPSEGQCLVYLDNNFDLITMQMLVSSETLNSEAVTVTQSSPCTMSVGTKELQYPYPIDGERYRKRVTPEGAIELTVPIAPGVHGGYIENNPFPIRLRGSQTVSLSLPHLNLDQQTIIPMSSNADWVSHFICYCLSGRERKVFFKNVTDKDPNVLFQMKCSMSTIFFGFMEKHKNRHQPRIFELVVKKRNDSDTLIFASNMRHNNTQGSFVLDAYVVPVTKKRLAEFLPSLKHLSSSKEIVRTDLSSRKEQALWKKLLPAQVESCRHLWNHSETCEYREHGRIPLSTEHGRSPICSCGEGKDILGFPRFKDCEIFAKYATRIAIVPLSAVPFLESPNLEGPKDQLDMLHSQSSTAAKAPGPKPDEKECDNCGQIPAGKLKKCMRCGNESYCNHACQKASWKKHRKECGKKK